MEHKNSWGGFRPGSGRKKGLSGTKKSKESTTFQFRLSIEEAEVLRARAKASNMNMTEFVKAILFPQKK